MWGECRLPEAWSQDLGHREEAHRTVFKGHKGMYSLDFMEIGGHRTLMITELGDAQTEAGVTSVGISLYGRLVATRSAPSLARARPLFQGRAFEPSPGPQGPQNTNLDQARPVYLYLSSVTVPGGAYFLARRTSATHHILQRAYYNGSLKNRHSWSSSSPWYTSPLSLCEPTKAVNTEAPAPRPPLGQAVGDLALLAAQRD
ncbi:hypothetical protein JB92DRAFT_2826057 [Gautieria morchelliformis]|nr:hypothetical protein JB92DRAFT_2826057 [Gautieria morchelliformis]